MHVYPLHRSSVVRLCAAVPHPDLEVTRQSVDATEDTLPSLLDELQQVPDFRHAQGRRHKLSTVLAICVLAICVLARRAGKVGGDATSRYAQSMAQPTAESRPIRCRTARRWRPTARGSTV